MKIHLVIAASLLNLGLVASSLGVPQSIIAPKYIKPTPCHACPGPTGHCCGTPGHYYCCKK